MCIVSGRRKTSCTYRTRETPHPRNPSRDCITRLIDAAIPRKTRRFYEDFLGLPLVDAFEIRETATGRSAGVLHSFYEMADGSCLAFFEVPRQPVRLQGPARFRPSHRARGGDGGARGPVRAGDWRPTSRPAALRTTGLSAPSTSATRTAMSWNSRPGRRMRRLPMQRSGPRNARDALDAWQRTKPGAD